MSDRTIIFWTDPEPEAGLSGEQADVTLYLSDAGRADFAIDDMLAMFARLWGVRIARVHWRIEEATPAAARSAPYVPTEAQATTSPLCLALAARGATERDVIDALFREAETWKRNVMRLANFQPVGPLVVDGDVYTNPTADGLAAEGHARVMADLFAEERAKGVAEERAVCVRIARGFGSEAVAAKIEARGESEQGR